MYDIAGRFYYREAEAIRKGLSWKERPWPKLWNWVFRLLCGYAERPERVVFWSVVVVFGLVAIYWASVLTQDLAGEAEILGLPCFVFQLA